MPKTALVASSWAMVRPPAPRIASRPERSSVGPHAREQGAPTALAPATSATELKSTSTLGRQVEDFRTVLDTDEVFRRFPSGAGPCACRLGRWARVRLAGRVPVRGFFHLKLAQCRKAMRERCGELLGHVLHHDDAGGCPWQRRVSTSVKACTPPVDAPRAMIFWVVSRWACGTSCFGAVGTILTLACAAALTLAASTGPIAPTEYDEPGLASTSTAPAVRASIAVCVPVPVNELSTITGMGRDPHQVAQERQPVHPGHLEHPA